MASRLTHTHAVIALAALAIFLLVARLPTYHEPIEWDIGTYSTIANEILHGERLYDEIWADVKPPAVYVTFAVMQAMTGNGPLELYLLSVIPAIATLLGVYYAASVAGRVAGLSAAAFWAAMCFDPRMGGDMPNTEVFINAAIAWAFALWVRGSTIHGERGWGAWFGVAALSFLASTYKQVAVAPVVCIAIVELIVPPPGEARRRTVARLALIAMLGAIGWAALFAYFAATGRGWIAWQTMVVSPRAYGGSQLQNLIDSFVIGKGLARELGFALPALGLTIIGALMRTQATPRRAWLLLAALFVGTHLAVALPGKFFPHYHQLWFVPLAIGAGWGGAALWELERSSSRKLARVAVALAAFTVVYPQLTWWPLSCDQRAQRKYGDFFMYANQAMRDVNTLLLPEETFYTWSDEAWAYPLTGRRVPAAGLWRLQMLDGPLAGWITQRTLADLNRNPPELLVTYGQLTPYAAHPVGAWALARYDALPGEERKHFPLYFYVRRGGSLEQRLSNAPKMHTPATTSTTSAP